MLHIQMDEALLSKLDDFRFKNRFESRSEAVRWLVSEALDKKLAPKPAGKKGE